MAEVSSGGVVSALQAAMTAQQASVDAAKAAANDAQPIPPSEPIVPAAAESEAQGDGQ